MLDVHDVAMTVMEFVEMMGKSKSPVHDAMRRHALGDDV